MSGCSMMLKDYVFGLMVKKHHLQIKLTVKDVSNRMLTKKDFIGVMLLISMVRIFS